MLPTALLQRMILLAADLSPWWRGLRIPTKVAATASMLVLTSMVYLGVLVTGHVTEGVVQRSAAAAAHYMDSFVEAHAQELATRSALSAESRDALERLLSPAAMRRPIVAFRIWKGDTIVFSNERQLVGNNFPRTAARERALQGYVVPEFERPDGDDDEQVRSLNLPILEVYAPVHERGTGRIIAIVETYEIAVGLKSEILASQVGIWLAIAVVALTLVMLLAGMANAGNSLLGQIAELTHLRAESERNRLRISHASLHVSEINERALQRFGDELHEGPAQLVALAMLKFDSLERLASEARKVAPGLDSEDMEELKTIRQALNEALHRIRGVAACLPLPDIEPLSVAETLARAARQHERLTGTAVRLETYRLPVQLPFPVKACLYRFVLESLGMYASTGAHLSRISVSSDSGRIVVRTSGSDATASAGPRPLAAHGLKLKSLRDRVEAVGGSVMFSATPAGPALIAELNLANMEPASG
jgi:signal transduction histidine kinase